MSALLFGLAFASTETLTTRDHVALAADVHLGEPGAAGVILLHMIPPHWDRTSWPIDVVKSLTDRGWSVCVPDRRGAGESKGKAKQAYEGEKGRYDVEACVKRLSAHGLGKLAVVGASNGTTSMIDYASWAASEKLPEPVLLGFMTGGTYTENNTPVSSVHRIPAVVMSSTEERAWSAKQNGVKGWTVVEYPTGTHGTKLFESVPEKVRSDLLDALSAALEN
jgi:pimeloyl-ACP methyl ester carboxylesterase